MLRKVLFFILVLNFLQSCGFEPIYSIGKLKKINIENIELNGDWELNNFIRASLLRYSSNKVSKKYNITVTTNNAKNIISKDSAGNPTNYEFIVEAKILVISENFEKEYLFSEKFLMENFDGQLVEENYERSNKINIANLIVNKLITQITRLE